MGNLVMKGIGVDCDVLWEFLIYWGFIHSPIHSNHFNTRIPKLGLRGPAKIVLRRAAGALFSAVWPGVQCGLARPDLRKLFFNFENILLAYWRAKTRIILLFDGTPMPHAKCD